MRASCPSSAETSVTKRLGRARANQAVIVAMLLVMPAHPSGAQCKVAGMGSADMATGSPPLGSKRDAMRTMVTSACKAGKISPRALNKVTARRGASAFAIAAARVACPRP